MKSIFPASIVKQTTESYQSRITVKVQTIYILLIVLLLFGILALPFIYVDIAVNSRGTFQTSLNRNEISASTGGRIESLFIKENKKVKKGDVLAVIRSENISLEMKGVHEKKSIIEDFVADLRRLLKHELDGNIMQNLALKSKFYQASLFEFQSTVQNQKSLLQKEQRDYDRAKLLYETQTIAFVDYDIAESQYDQVKSNLDLLLNRKKSEWEQELFNYQRDLLNLINQEELLFEKLDQYKVISNVSGTLINVPNLELGDFVFPNQKLGEISPDSTLIGITYLAPADIAFIEKGQSVFFQVDAYNYNQWGLAKGTVLDISDDLNLISEKEAGFLITCLLNTPLLNLKNGIGGEIKKGMTFNARFVIARRSLYQLFYDKVDDWLNPSVQ